jgi:hypothetical protein
MFNTRRITLTVQSYPIRPIVVRYMLEIDGCNNRWADSSIRPYMQPTRNGHPWSHETRITYINMGYEHVRDVWQRDQPYFGF